jgi:peptidoglycan/xylan/chitin deacetylase (PgdA/CDA1 family)
METILRTINDYLILQKFLIKRWRYKPILILNFHQISSQFNPKIDLQSNWTSLNSFNQTIGFLQANNYQLISLKEAVNIVESKQKRKKHYAAITFDDGYASILNILPYLEKNKIPVTFFINTAYLDDKLYNWVDIVNYVLNVADKSEISSELFESINNLNKTQNSVEFFKEKEIAEDFAKKIKDWPSRWLTTEELFGIKNPLFSIGLHGHEHLKYDIMPDEICKRNLEKNIEILEQHPNYVPFFAFPFGRWEERNLKTLSELGLTPFFHRGGLNYTTSVGYNRIGVSDQMIDFKFISSQSREITAFNKIYAKLKQKKAG